MDDPVGPAHRLGTVLAISVGLLASLSATASPGPPGRASAAAATVFPASPGLHLPVVRRLSDGTRIACTTASDCAMLEAALVTATRTLDPVLPSSSSFSAVTLIAPTSTDQLAVVGTRRRSAPAATTLLVGQELVERGLAAPTDRGRVWIVVNPSVVAAGTEMTVRVLAHELVHVRTRAADLPGPLWVEEGLAVALVDRATASGPAPAAADASSWPADDWVPTTLDDYAVAGAVVHRLSERVGWEAVGRWYAATADGTPSVEAARLVGDPGTGRNHDGA